MRVILGDEYDERLASALVDTLRSMGASLVSSSNGLGGSQELRVDTYAVGDQTVVIQFETYIGLSIEAPDQLAQLIVTQIGGQKLKD